MPQSFCKIYTHLIFSTKNRQKLIDSSIRPRVHAYLATLVRDLECPYVVVGGVEDHVHLLMDIGKRTLPVDIVAKIKKESSKFVKTLAEKYRRFYWQNGYGMFSVGPTQVDKVRQYIENQREHHKKQTFQEEFRAFLIKYKVEYDERYVWD